MCFSWVYWDGQIKENEAGREYGMNEGDLQNQKITMYKTTILPVVYGFMALYSAWCLGYGMDSPGFYSHQGQEIFIPPKHPDRVLRPPSLLYNRYWG